MGKASTDPVVLTGDIHSSWANDLPRDPTTYPVNRNSVGGGVRLPVGDQRRVQGGTRIGDRRAGRHRRVPNRHPLGAVPPGDRAPLCSPGRDTRAGCRPIYGLCEAAGTGACWLIDASIRMPPSATRRPTPRPRAPSRSPVRCTSWVRAATTRAPRGVMMGTDNAGNDRHHTQQRRRRDTGLVQLRVLDALHSVIRQLQLQTDLSQYNSFASRSSAMAPAVT